MRKIFVLLSLLSYCSCCHAQLGIMKWHFSSRSQVVQALQKQRGNLRATYEVLICAARQGYTNTSIGFYENVVVGHEFDASAQDSAAYAFAFDLGYSSRPWNWTRDSDQSIIKKSSRATAMYFRDRARSLRPNLAEVLIMRSFWEHDQEGEIRIAGYKSALKGVNRSPLWSDAYVWLGEAEGGYADTLATRILDKDVKSEKELKEKKAMISHLGRLMLRAYDKAEKLDPSLRSQLFIERVYAYDHIADKKSGQMIPILVNAHLRTFPSFGTWYYQKTGRTIQKFRQDWANRVAEITKDAQA